MQGKDDHLRLGGEVDTLFSREGYPKPFAFNEAVANVFDDMVTRSIPLYGDVIKSLQAWAVKFHVPGTIVYDVGCSTGTTLAAIAQAFDHHGLRGHFVGIDPAKAMLCKAETKLASYGQRHDIELIDASAVDVAWRPANLIIMNYTLQFLSINDRRRVLRQAHDALVEGGLLVVSEKVRFATPEFQETITRLYEGFKEERGYSSTEIARKKEALENVLVPLSSREQIRLIEKAGFDAVEPIMQWHNFVTFVALKDR